MIDKSILKFFAAAVLVCVLGLSISEAEAAGGGKAKGGIAPTHKNVKHGSDDNDIMNVWLVESDEPTPVIVHIHGGGFKSGKLTGLLSKSLMQRFQEANISYISIDYRLIDANHTEIQPLLRDLRETLAHIGRAIQFIRSRSEEWNIDPNLLGCTGGSAGAAASMWLAFHDDMADASNADPVLRESTRIACAYATNVAGVSMDPLNPERIRLGKTTPVKRSMQSRAASLGLSSIEEARSLLVTPEMRKIRKDLGLIEWISADDPPVALYNITPYDTYNGNVHNPHSIPVIKKYCEENGVECISIMFNTPKEEIVETYDFLIEKLSEARDNQ
jgi:acetyl esterase/lipase